MAEYLPTNPVLRAFFDTGAAFGPLVELRPLADGTRPAVPPEIREWTATREHRTAFVETFLDAQRGGARERARLAEEWLP